MSPDNGTPGSNCTLVMALITQMGSESPNTSRKNFSGDLRRHTVTEEAMSSSAMDAMLVLLASL
jgi:hypothetical protein